VVTMSTRQGYGFANNCFVRVYYCTIGYVSTVNMKHSIICPSKLYFIVGVSLPIRTDADRLALPGVDCMLLQ
jgi:hypothetical protein